MSETTFLPYFMTARCVFFYQSVYFFTNGVTTEQICKLVDIATLNLGVRAECFQGEGALSGNLRRHLIVRRSANIDMVLKCTLNSDVNGFKEWKVTGGGGGGEQYHEKKTRSWPSILDMSI